LNKPVYEVLYNNTKNIIIFTSYNHNIIIVLQTMHIFPITSQIAKEQCMEFLAHISDDGRKQTVQEHLEGTARLCSEFAAEFDAAEQGYLAGISHDIGKYTEAF